MKRYIEGVDRDQVALFPDRLEDWVGEDNAVRVIDAFVDGLDFAGWDLTAPSRSHGSAWISSCSAAEALCLRLFEPGAVKPPA